MVQQFVMMSTTPPITQQSAGQQAGWSQAATQLNFIPQAILNFAPTQQWGQHPSGACGSNPSRNGSGQHNPRSPAQPGAPLLFVGGTQMVPFSKGAAIPYPGRHAACAAAKFAVFHCDKTVGKPECVFHLRI
jgi:hypothetical protein